MQYRTWRQLKREALRLKNLLCSLAEQEDRFCQEVSLAALDVQLEDIALIIRNDLNSISPANLESLQNLRNATLRGDLRQAVAALEAFEEAVDNEGLVILVDFLVFRQSHWPACRELIEAFSDQQECRVRVVAMPVMREAQDDFGEASRQRMIEDGYTPISYAEYIRDSLRPDIIIDDMADDGQRAPGLRFLDIRQKCDHIVQFEHAIFTGYTERMKESRIRIGRTECWQYLVPSPPFTAALPLVFNIRGGIIDCGCPEIDIVVKSIAAENERPDSILWNLDAPILGEANYEDLARIDFMVDAIEAIVLEDPGQKHIVRAHPVCYNSHEGLRRVKRVVNLTQRFDNIVLDNSSDILGAYRRAKGFVTWMSSTTAMTFLATGRPMAVIPSYVDGGFDTIMDMALLDALYVIDTIGGLRDFCNRICCCEEDEMSGKRAAAAERYLGLLDGKGGSRIAEEIIRRYLKDVQL